MSRGSRYLCLAAASFSVLVCLPVLGFGFTFDQGVYSAMGDTLCRGGVAYLDAWESRTPGTCYVYSVAFRFLGREIWSVRILELVALGATGLSLFLLVARRTRSVVGAGAASILFPLSYLALGQNTAQAESFQLPFLVSALLAWPEPAAGEGLRSRCVTAGFLLSFAVLIHAPSLLVVVPLLADRLHLDRRKSGLLAKADLSLCTLGATLVPLLLMFSYYAIRGAGSLVVDAVIVFPAGHLASAWGSAEGGALLGAVGWLGWLVPWPHLALILAGLFRGSWVDPQAVFRWGAVFFATWVSVALQGRYFPYQHLSMLPFLAWGAGLLFVRSNPVAGQPAGASSLTPRPVLIGGVILLAMSLGMYVVWILPHLSGFPRLARILQDNGVPDERGEWRSQRELAERIRGLSREEDRMFVWGDAPLLYMMGDRRMAHRTSHLMQVIPPWEGETRLARLVQDLDLEKPRWIIVCPGQLWWRGGQTPSTALAGSSAMDSLLKRSYLKVDELKGYQIWGLSE